MSKPYIMLQLNDYINVLTDFKQRQAPKFGIKSIGIFGSVARREANESSDIDIVVDVEHPTMSVMYYLRQELASLFSCDVDVVRMRESLRPALKKNIERDVIYV